MEFFYVITNPTKDAALRTARSIKDYLTRHGKTCIVDVGMKKPGKERYTYKEQVKPDVDCIIVLGGDGTLLQAAVDLADRDIPFLGINLGTLGFLAEINRSGTEDALDKLIRGEYEIEKRMMISGQSFGKMGEKDHARALNDIVITRKGSLQIIVFHIFVNGQLLYTCHADGILVATPTGSTGYNLSAGGPIVEPHAELILLTPICPHSMNSRTIVLSAEDEVVIEIGENKKKADQEMEACFDGSVKMTMRTGDKMEIRRAEKVTEMLKLRQDSFVEVLHRKMDAE